MKEYEAKKGMTIKMSKTQLKLMGGLYLGPTSGKGFETVGNGLYLMKQGGLILGSKNNPLKNISILGMIL